MLRNTKNECVIVKSIFREVITFSLVSTFLWQIPFLLDHDFHLFRNHRKYSGKKAELFVYDFVQLFTLFAKTTHFQYVLSMLKFIITYCALKPMYYLHFI